MKKMTAVVALMAVFTLAVCFIILGAISVELMDALEINEGQFGTLAMGLFLTRCIVQLIIGPMVDKLGYKPIACGKCKEKCEREAIDFDQVPEDLNIEVGTVIVATGVDVYDPTVLDDYGYTNYLNVITSLEFERLINAGGPSAGRLIRPSDGKIPKKVGRKPIKPTKRKGLRPLPPPPRKK